MFRRIFTYSQDFVADMRIAVKFAQAESIRRGRSFIIFIACLLLASFTLATLTNIVSSIQRGIDKSARSLLDGDVSIYTTYNQLTGDELDFLQQNSSSFSLAGMLRANLRLDDGANKLIEIKAIDQNYPQYAIFQPANLLEALQQPDPASGEFSIIIDSSLVNTLGLSAGDSVSIGSANFKVAGIIQRETDLNRRNFSFAPRVVMSINALRTTGLLAPGSLVSWRHAIALPPELSAVQFSELWKTTFSQQSWSIVGSDDAAPNINRALNRIGNFLLLVELATLIIAGIGIANSFSAYIQTRRKPIAVWKCMGATRQLVRRIYILQCCKLACIGIIPGLVLGAFVPVLLADPLGNWLNIAIVAYPDWQSVVHQLILLGLITASFVMIPLFIAENIPALELFRGAARVRLTTRQIATLAITCLITAGYVIVSSNNYLFTIYFTLGLFVTILFFYLLARLITKLVAPLTPKLIAVSLARFDSATTSVTISIGLGLAMLLLIAIFQTSLVSDLLVQQSEEHPSLFLIGVNPDQTNELNQQNTEFQGLKTSYSVPTLRAQITQINKIPVAELDESIRRDWVVAEPRTVTWSNAVTNQQHQITSGTGWDEDYAGKLLVSFSSEEAEDLYIQTGDTITIEILGRSFVAEVNSIREVDWTNFAMNFVMIFSPGELRQAPHSYIYSLYMDDEVTVDKYLGSVINGYPNVTAIRVAEILREVRILFASLLTILAIIGTIVLTAGLLVMAGQAVVRQQLLTYQTTIYRLCGGSNRQIITIITGFYLFVGIIASIAALLVASVASYLLIDLFLGQTVSYNFIYVLSLLALTGLTTIITGLVCARLALNVRPIQLLHNQ